MQTPFVIGFVGHSGSGKTTLATQVTARLSAQGLEVAAIKNAHHGFDLDKPDKDTWRYREAGAHQVIVRTEERWALLVEAKEVPPFEALLAHCVGVDVVLVEGFKNEGQFPKIEVRRQGASESHPRLWENNADIVALATNDPVEKALAQSQGLPVLNLDDIDQVSEFILKRKASL